MAPDTRKRLKVRFLVLLLTILAPERCWHAEERLGDDELALFSTILNVLPFEIPNLNLHSKSRCRNLSRINRAQRRAHYD